MSVNRNDPCPCGSGKKYKKCCMSKSAAAAPATTAAPGRPHPGLAEAKAKERAGRLEMAASAYWKVLDDEPRNAAALYGLGRIVRALGSPDRAIDLFRRAIEADGARPAYHVDLADTLLDAGQSDAALAAGRRAAALAPKLVAAHRWLALAHERLNHRDDAQRSAETALAIEPGDAQAGIVLARLDRRAGQRPRARARLETILDRTDLPAQHRHLAANELGFVLDGLGVYDAAFAAFEASGRAAEESPVAQRLDRDAMNDIVDEYRTGLTAELLGRWTPDAFDDGHPTPAFLVGFPRSGTTMTEQILAAHDDVVTTDERPLLQGVKGHMAELVPGGAANAAALDRLDRDMIRTLRAGYWRRAESMLERDLAGKILIDKFPLNIIEVGLINVIFPEARVIVALRDPRDVCLSCFMQAFMLNEAMIHFVRWRETALFYAKVMGLWLHLRDRLTLRFVEVRYEDTVVDLDGQARRILGLLDAAWSDDIRRFHEKAGARHIRTPSFAAVTEPVHTRAVARWKNYEKRFAEVDEILRPFVEALGYGEGEA